MKRMLAVTAVLAVIAAGCLPQAATTQGQSINTLYTIAIGMSAIVLATVWVPTSWAILRYRRRRRRRSDGGADDAANDDLPPQTAGSRVAETIWTAGPLLAIVILFGLTLVTLNMVNAAPGQDAVKLQVDAFRWGWRMTYPDDGVSVEGVRAPGPEAVLPVGRPIQITLTSQDVIHSFFVPKFLYKKDAIPGHPNTFTINIDQPGSYAGECAELCGIYHSQMPFTITAVSDTDYQAWLAAQRAAASASPEGSAVASPEASAGASP